MKSMLAQLTSIAGVFSTPRYSPSRYHPPYQQNGYSDFGVAGPSMFFSPSVNFSIALILQMKDNESSQAAMTPRGLEDENDSQP
jgi:hypothetical protein